MAVREAVWLGNTVAVEDVVSYHTSPLEHAVTWEKQENLEMHFLTSRQAGGVYHCEKRKTGFVYLEMK